MKKSLEEIIAAVDPAQMRQSLTEHRERMEKDLADHVAAYLIEEANQMLSDEERAKVLEIHAKRIEALHGSIVDINERLDTSDKALTGRRNGATAK